MLGYTTKIQKALAEKVLTVEEHGKESITQMRLAACSVCPNFDKENRKCLECGCFLDVKAKLKQHRNPKALGRVEITHCPNGLWNDKEIANHYRKKDGKELID